MKDKITFGYLFMDASYKVFRFVCLVANIVLRFKVERVPRDIRNYIVLFNETRVTNGFIPFIACTRLVNHVVMDYIKGRWYGGMIRAHLNTVFIDQTAPLAAMREVLRRMRKGRSFVLFPEGRYSQDGITAEVSESTGAFIKSLGRTLVTYRISGGYLRFPTWSVKSRKGPVTGKVVAIYTPEQIRSMTAAELTACINRDLYVNSYEDQEKSPAEYPGKDLAVGLETIFSICPKCGGFSTIVTEGDGFHCTSCGMKGHVDNYGYLKSRDFDFTTIPELEKAEFEIFDRKHDEAGNNEEPFLRFENVTLEKLGEDFRPAETSVGSLLVFKDNMEIEDCRFEYTQLRELRTLRGVKKGGPQLSVRTEKERYMLSGGNLCPWMVRRTADIACGTVRDKF